MNYKRWTRDEIVASLLRFHSKHDRLPLRSEYNHQHGLMSVNTVLDHFGSVGKCIRRAGLDPKIGTAGYWTRKRVLNALQQYVKVHGTLPKRSRWGGGGLPSVWKIEGVFGSAEKAIRLAKVPGRQNSYTKEELLESIRVGVWIIGNLPSTFEDLLPAHTENPLIPHPATFRKHFPSLKKARKLAGFRPS